MFRFVICILLHAFFLPATLHAGTWYVQSDGLGMAPTVQAGIDSAAVGDTVLVGAGTYLENIDFKGKDIVLISEAGPEFTILDGSTASESVVLFTNGETRCAILEGFTITGGSGHIPDVEAAIGAGVFCNWGSPTIQGNIFTRNETTNSFGGGIFIGALFDPPPFLAPLVQDNIFKDNVAVLGGGIAVLWGDPIIQYNVFIRNGAERDGGGMFIWMRDGSPVVRNNEFWENFAADHGGGVYAANRLTASNLVITGNLFARNVAIGGDTGDTGSGGGIWTTLFTGEISNNTLVGNIGQGESLCSGGGIVLSDAPTDLIVQNNILAFNDGCGISCKDAVGVNLGPNLLWENREGDLGTGAGACPLEWQDVVIIADPLFCGIRSDDYTVDANSPALTDPGPMGAFPDPGCGTVAVLPITWGQLKSRYE